MIKWCLSLIIQNLDFIEVLVFMLKFYKSVGGFYFKVKCLSLRALT